jgi:hypothetical protein
MIDDQEGSSAVEANGDTVDLYGYASLAVATLQLQARQIDDLKAEIEKLKKDRSVVKLPDVRGTT